MSTATEVLNGPSESSPNQTQPARKFWRSKRSPNVYTLHGSAKDRVDVYFSVEGQEAPIVGVPNDLHWFSGGRLEVGSSTFVTFSLMNQAFDVYPSEPIERYGCCVDESTRRATIFSRPHLAMLPLHLMAFDYRLVNYRREHTISYHVGEFRKEVDVFGLSAALDVVLDRNIVSPLDFIKAMAEFFPANFWASTFWHVLWSNAIYGKGHIALSQYSGPPLAQALGWECLVHLLDATARWLPDKIEPLREDALWSNIPTSKPPLPPLDDGSFTWLETAQFYRAAYDEADRVH